MFATLRSTGKAPIKCARHVPSCAGRAVAAKLAMTIAARLAQAMRTAGPKARCRARISVSTEYAPVLLTTERTSS